jgi:hypothetical protein
VRSGSRVIFPSAIQAEHDHVLRSAGQQNDLPVVAAYEMKSPSRIDCDRLNDAHPCRLWGRAREPQPPASRRMAGEPYKSEHKRQGWRRADEQSVRHVDGGLEHWLILASLRVQ